MISIGFSMVDSLVFWYFSEVSMLVNLVLEPIVISLLHCLIVIVVGHWGF